MVKKIAILGGGVTGLASAYYLKKKYREGVSITLFEALPKVGGLAAGFKKDSWEWSLEHAYHHAFATDTDFLALVKEIGFEDSVFFKRPLTASLYEVGSGGAGSTDNYRIFPVDSPRALLNFPLLSVIERVRMGVVLLCLRLLPFIKSIYEGYSLTSFLNTLLGKHTTEILFGEPLRKKYGKYAGNILATFIWARIKTRTPSLGYVTGGYEAFTRALVARLTDFGTEIHTATQITNMSRRGDSFALNIKSGDTLREELFDVVINTLPTSATIDVAHEVLSRDEIESIGKITHTGAKTLILETTEPVLKDVYWLSVCTPKIPGLVFVQHTNYIDKRHYNGNHILYIGNYLDYNDPLYDMSKEDMIALYTPHIESLAGRKIDIIDSFMWRARDAQTVIDQNFIANIPRYETSVKGFYMANLDMTYPYDRGVNYAIRLGREVVEVVEI